MDRNLPLLLPPRFLLFPPFFWPLFPPRPGLAVSLVPSSVTAMRLTWISRSASSRSRPLAPGEAGRGRESESDGGHTISASASASSLCSGVWECWCVSSDDSSEKERSQAEQLNCERDCDCGCDGGDEWACMGRKKKGALNQPKDQRGDRSH